MKIKYIGLLLTTSVLTLGTNPSWAETSSESRLNFNCQVNEGIPTTVARQANSEVSVPVFHWKSEALPDSSDAKQLCDRVAAKLEDYSAQGYDLSNIGFGSAEQVGLPAICATGGVDGDCSLVLFTLAPAEQPVDVANDVLSAILDKRLQSNKRVSKDGKRGVQSYSYEVNFLTLLGLKFIK